MARICSFRFVVVDDAQVVHLVTQDRRRRRRAQTGRTMVITNAPRDFAYKINAPYLIRFKAWK